MKTTIKDTLIKEIDCILLKKKQYYDYGDFDNLDLFEFEEYEQLHLHGGGFLNYRGKVFNKYVRSLGYEWVRGNLITFKKLDGRRLYLIKMTKKRKNDMLELQEKHTWSFGNNVIIQSKLVEESSSEQKSKLPTS